jgi:hypothetical protein
VKRVFQTLGVLLVAGPFLWALWWGFVEPLQE